jgi:hypothetical protein
MRVRKHQTAAAALHHVVAVLFFFLQSCALNIIIAACRSVAVQAKVAGGISFAGRNVLMTMAAMGVGTYFIHVRF